MAASHNLHSLKAILGWKQGKTLPLSSSTDAQRFTGKKMPHEVFTNSEGDKGSLDGEEHAAPESFVVPTKTLSIVILVFLLITHILLGHECVAASKSLKASIENDDVASRSITYWKASPGENIAVHFNVHWYLNTAPKVVAKFNASEAEDVEFEVYGNPETDRGNKRLHVVSPVNGWVTEVTKKGKRFMEPLSQEEEPLKDKTSNVPFCPLFDAGYNTRKLAMVKYAPTSLVVAQQFWNAAQVFHYFLLISLYSIMTSPSFFISTPIKHGKCILWTFFILFTILTVMLLPFSLYFINPGGQALAVIMAIVSLGTIYLSPPNVQFSLAGLPPRCCTPRQHPSTEMKRKEEDEECEPLTNGSTRNFADTNAGDGVLIYGRGLCKVELIACLCNLGSSMYNYNTSRDRVFPNWNGIFHAIDKWLGLKTGGDVNFNYQIKGRFMYNMGIKSYHQPLFMPLDYGSTTGCYAFLFLWSILPFIYISYFMSMYIMARRVPGVRIQRFFALFGVLHFLFFTDIVAYKFGRGLRNEWSEHFHWAERLAWRIAVLLPIYQNVLSGHYRHPQRNKCIGPALHYFMAAWGIMFFFYQFLINDCHHYPQWLRGQKQTRLFGIHYTMKLGYLGTLVVMVFVYGFMMLGGTWCHHVYIRTRERVGGRGR